MLVGMAVGVLVGVPLVFVLGTGVVEIALAAFVAMLAATVLTDSPRVGSSSAHGRSRGPCILQSAGSEEE